MPASIFIKSLCSSLLEHSNNNNNLENILLKCQEKMKEAIVTTQARAQAQPTQAWGSWVRELLASVIGLAQPVQVSSRIQTPERISSLRKHIVLKVTTANALPWRVSPYA